MAVSEIEVGTPDLRHLYQDHAKLQHRMFTDKRRKDNYVFQISKFAADPITEAIIVVYSWVRAPLVHYFEPLEVVLDNFTQADFEHS